ncbi:hypothetical protein K0M31_002683 [Melipona bicolor]|uniref:Uncharacterized protein n=1 Tax=Melipona bicolor TaxID=60889 RepID=A0AA40FZI1_9HYME|nr:hypothetical protein K0M31_002683 [Melipona bicolor]
MLQLNPLILNPRSASWDPWDYTRDTKERLVPHKRTLIPSDGFHSLITTPIIRSKKVERGKMLSTGSYSSFSHLYSSFSEGSLQKEPFEEVKTDD